MAQRAARCHATHAGADADARQRRTPTPWTSPSTTPRCGRPSRRPCIRRRPSSRGRPSRRFDDDDVRDPLAGVERHRRVPAQRQAATRCGAPTASMTTGRWARWRSSASRGTRDRGLQGGGLQCDPHRPQPAVALRCWMRVTGSGCSSGTSSATSGTPRRCPTTTTSYFPDWWQRDLTSMLLRDRNHPSVIIWSIGNEISADPNNYGPAPGGAGPLPRHRQAGLAGRLNVRPAGSDRVAVHRCRRPATAADPDGALTPRYPEQGGHPERGHRAGALRRLEARPRQPVVRRRLGVGRLGLHRRGRLGRPPRPPQRGARSRVWPRRGHRRSSTPGSATFRATST